MLRDETKRYIAGLGDAALLEYVLMGTRCYEPAAVAFAQEELERRKLPTENLAALRPAVVAKVAAYDEHVAPDMGGPSVAREGILCQVCGYEVPNRYVTYRQNIGAMAVRFSQTYRRHFRRKCSRRFFWKSTAITLCLGWWGTISFFLTPVFLFGNVVEFFGALRIPRAPADARRPVCDETVVGKMGPHVYLLTERLNSGADVADIAREIAALAGMTPVEAWCFIQRVPDQQPGRKAPAVEAHGGVGALRIRSMPAGSLPR